MIVKVMGKNVLEATGSRHLSVEIKGTRKAEPEQRLRQRAVVLIHEAPVHSYNSLFSLYSSMGIFPTINEIQEALATGIQTAQRGTHWGNEKEGIKIGYYTNDESFYTTLLHEAGHYSLTQFGRDPRTYEKDPLPEETFCWSFAQRLATILNLPFSEEQADLDLQTAFTIETLKGNGNNDQVFDLLDELINRETQLKGFSAFNQQGNNITAPPTFIWSDEGIPQLVE